MKKPKLTDEELSRVLSLEAAGLLDYWAARDDEGDGFACVAFAATAEPAKDTSDPDRWWALSDASSPMGIEFLDYDYPTGVDKVLRYLEKRGLA